MTKTIAYITDPHVDEPFTLNNNVDARTDMETILQEVSEAGIREVVIGGDIGEKRALPFFFDCLTKYVADVKVTLGNHDHFNDVLPFFNPLKAPQSELFYSEEDSVYKYIFLDSSSEEISPVQLTWFKAAMNTPKKVILFIHHPVLPVDAAVDWRYPLKGRDTMYAILKHHPAEVYVFCGHYHLADEQTAGHVHQYVTPAVSLQFVKPAAELQLDRTVFGYRVITITDTAVTTEVIWKKR